MLKFKTPKVNNKETSGGSTPWYTQVQDTADGTPLVDGKGRPVMVKVAEDKLEDIVTLNAATGVTLEKFGYNDDTFSSFGCEAGSWNKYFVKATLTTLTADALI